MTNMQKKTLLKMSSELESYDHIMHLLTDKVHDMRQRIEDSFDQNPPADDQEKEYVEEILEDMQLFIDQNVTSLLYLSEQLEVE